MNPGEKYEKQFLHLKFGGFNDSTQSNQITGAGPGYAGHGGKCYALDYAEACKDVDGKPPPFVLSVIDELDI